MVDDGSPYVPAPVEPKREPLDASDPSETRECDVTSVNTSSPAEAVDVIVIDDDEEPVVSDLQAPAPVSLISMPRHRYQTGR